MDVREKLVELLDDIQVRGEDFTDYEIYGMRVPDTVSNEDVASHLIAHGVTVQEWIPVTERLPNHWEDVLVRLQCGDCVVAVRSGLIWRVRWNSTLLDREPTHWMPLPQPPKE